MIKIFQSVSFFVKCLKKIWGKGNKASNLHKLQSGQVKIEHIHSAIIALGGYKNIKTLKSVAITRIRVQVYQASIVSLDGLKSSGLLGYQAFDKGVYHMLIGVSAKHLANEVWGTDVNKCNAYTYIP